MALKKGDAALSESMMNIISLVLSFVLIILVARGIFGQSADTAYQSAFVPAARDIATTIDRTVALAGSQAVYLKMPEGMNINVTIDNKVVEVIYDKGTAEQTFSGLIHSGPYFFQNPKEFCLVKNRDDRRVTIVSGKCVCNMGDGICDPACSLDFKCDSDCITEKVDNFCSKLCFKPEICDPDCNANDKDLVCAVACIKPGERDRICDPDCNNTKKGVVDLDCIDMYNGTGGFGGVCDADYMPKSTLDGICYTGCAVKKVSGDIIKLSKDGICDPDCNQTNGICDPDCNGDPDCEDKCANVGENCTNMPCCQQDAPEACCPGTQVCNDASDKNKPACCGNGKCEVAPYVADMIRQKISGKLASGEYEWSLPSFSGADPATNWENAYTCPQDCTAFNINPKSDGWNAGNHIHTGDSICDGTKDSICDVVDCTVSSGYGIGTWTNAGESDNYLFCDPDCSLHPGCPHADSRDQAVQDGFCLQTKNDGCDPDCSNNTKICDPDCCAFNSKSACPTSPGCYCPVRVNMSDNFKKAPALYDTNADLANQKVYWTDNVLEICSDSAIKYLDRRGWDIKQVEKEITMPDPLGFAFDSSRYDTIRNSQGKCTPQEEGSFVQKASKTIDANEAYNMTDNVCCAYYCGKGCENAKYTGTLCDGIGFCGDHSPAMLTILRTLGVPAYDVYAGFARSMNPQFSHAYVIYFCDPSLPENLKMAACSGNENKWLRVDATHHKIELFEGTQFCDHFCIAYNDYGVFAQINATKYGFGGAYDSTTGYAFPMKGMSGAASSGSLNSVRGLNCQPDPACLLNRVSPPGLCTSLGLAGCKIA